MLGGLKTGGIGLGLKLNGWFGGGGGIGGIRDWIGWTISLGLVNVKTSFPVLS